MDTQHMATAAVARPAGRGRGGVPTADARSRPVAPSSPTGVGRKRKSPSKGPPEAVAAPPIVDATGLKQNHIRLHADSQNPEAAQFQLRLKNADGKRGELTEVARSNLLIELALAKGDREEEVRVCSHYGVHRNTGREMLKRWRQRATVVTAPRSGRPRLAEGQKKSAKKLPEAAMAVPPDNP